MRANTFYRLIATSALTALLTACGGGSGGGSFLGGGGGGGLGGLGGGSSEDHSSVTINVNNDLTQSNPNSFLTAEYNRTAGSSGSTGLAQINAAAAYGMGATGLGIKIGIIDTGIAAGNSEFAGALSADSINIVNGSHSDLQGANPHGTWVAGVIGARKNDTYTHGVAFDSQLLVIRTDTSSTACPSGCFASNDLVNAVNYAGAHGAQIVNMSFGARGDMGSAFTTAIKNAVSQHDILFVAAAGNGSYSSVDSPASLGSVSGIAGNLLAVGAVDSSNNIASWSNRAGNAAAYYLVAPGVNIVTTDENGMALVAGTSFAAPMVSGAAALVKQYAPYLTSAQVAQVLLDTATDLGAPGVDLIYGHGLLNVGAALQPVGTSSVPNSGHVQDNTGPAVEATTLSLGSAFGSALANNNLLQRGIMVDSFGRAFGFDMSKRVASSQYTSGLQDFIASGNETTTGGARIGNTTVTSSFTAGDEHKVRELKEQDKVNGDTRVALTSDIGAASSVGYTHGYGVGQAFGLTAENDGLADTLASKAAYGNAYLNLVQGGNAALADMALADGLTLKVASGAETGTQDFTSDAKTSGSRSAYAAALNYDMGSASIGLNAGMVDEGKGMLGSNSDGALAFGQNSSTTFVGATARLDLRRGLTLAASYTIGSTSIGNASDSLIGDFKNVRSDSFAVALTADDVARKDDRLTLGMSQPVRVMSGSANLTVPTGVDDNGAVQYENQRVKLAPSGREVDVQAGYAMKISENETVAFSAVSAFNPGNDATADNAYSVGIRYNKKF